MDKFLIVILLLVMVVQVHAFTPVIDVNAIRQMVSQLNQMKRSYKLLKAQYDNGLEQLTVLKDIKDGFHGHYDYGKLLNDAQSLDEYRWSPAKWKDTMMGLAGKNPERYKALMKQYLENNKKMSIENIEKYGINDISQAYSNQFQFLANSKTQSIAAYDAVDDHMKRITTLNNKIDLSENAKSAMDLNARLLVELSYLTTEEIKMQSLINHQLSEQHAKDLRQASDAVSFANYFEGK